MRRQTNRPQHYERAVSEKLIVVREVTHSCFELLLVAVFCGGTGFDGTAGFLLLVVVGVLLLELLAFELPIPTISKAACKKEDKNMCAGWVNCSRVEKVKESESLTREDVEVFSAKDRTATQAVTSSQLILFEEIWNNDRCDFRFLSMEDREPPPREHDVPGQKAETEIHDTKNVERVTPNLSEVAKSDDQRLSEIKKKHKQVLDQARKAQNLEVEADEVNSSPTQKNAW